MKDLYLRFEDAAEMRRVLISFGFKEDQNNYLYYTGISLDVIGKMTQSDNGKIVEGIFIDEPSTSSSGYHVNIRISEDDLDTHILDPYVISPETPSRVWA